MKVMIIEDEPSNERHLRRLLEKVLPEAETVISTDSVSSSVDFLSRNRFVPDLVFADIQLADGLCFDIFNEVGNSFPVIFTTAYDSFAIKAFEYNALSYLLKPVMERDLKIALAKTSRLTHPLDIKNMNVQIKELSKGLTAYLKRVLLESGTEMFPAEVSNICLLESDFRSVTVYLNDGRHGFVNHPLRYFENALNPKHFIRVSRKYIIDPSKGERFRKTGDGHCEAVFASPIDIVVEFPVEKLNGIKAMFGK